MTRLRRAALVVMLVAFGAVRDAQGQRRRGGELPVPATVGEIVAITAVADGVALLSRSGPRLLYRGQGAAIETIGSRGFGPGEYASPVALDGVSHNMLLLLDSQREALNWYQRRGARWQFVAAASPVAGGSLCSFAGHVVVLSGSSEGLLTEYRLDAPGKLTRLRTFGRPVLLDHPDRANPIVQDMVASGKVICSPDGSWVAHADRSFGEVRVFDARREMSAHVRLSPFEALSVRVERARVVNSVPPNGRFDEIRDVVALDRMKFAVSVARMQRSRSGALAVSSYRLVEFSARGEQLRVLATDGVLGSVTRGRTLCYTPHGKSSLFESAVPGSCLRK